jgi:hypothetical protein
MPHSIIVLVPRCDGSSNIPCHDLLKLMYKNNFVALGMVMNGQDSTVVVASIISGGRRCTVILDLHRNPNYVTAS